MFRNFEDQSQTLRQLLTQARHILAVRANDGGPPPGGPPLLAERWPAYERLIREVATLTAQALRMETTYGPRISRNWPARLRTVHAWATWRGDILGMALAARLTPASPNQALVFVESFTEEAGWALETVLHDTCWDDYGHKPFPPAEQWIAKRLQRMIDRYHGALDKQNHALNSAAFHWLHDR